MTHAKERAQQRSIRALFTRIAPHYDRVNRLISMGQDQRLRRRALHLAQVPPGGTLLDVGTGTGDVALQAQALYPHCRIVALDPTASMLTRAREKAGDNSIGWTLGDGLALPYPNDTFDAVISAFLMRNVPDVPATIDEQVRIVRPGGRVVCLEMTWPRQFPMSQLFHIYFFGWVPWMGQIFTGDRAAYEYLPKSVKAFIPPQKLEEHMRASGLTRIRWRQYVLGTIAIYVGEKSSK